jgi:hypothetical protein
LWLLDEKYCSSIFRPIYVVHIEDPWRHCCPVALGHCWDQQESALSCIRSCQS